jgi:hypothetical protein
MLKELNYTNVLFNFEQEIFSIISTNEYLYKQFICIDKKIE